MNPMPFKIFFLTALSLYPSTITRILCYATTHPSLMATVPLTAFLTKTSRVLSLHTDIFHPWGADTLMNITPRLQDRKANAGLGTKNAITDLSGTSILLK